MKKRIVSIFMYGLLFFFSVYAIIILRLRGEAQSELRTILFRGEEITQHEFFMLKLTLFVIVAGLSYVLMLSNLYYYKHPSLEERIIQRTHKEIMHLKKVEHRSKHHPQHSKHHSTEHQPQKKHEIKNI